MKYPTTKFEAIGTGWEITLGQDVDYKAWIGIVEKIYREIDDFDKAFSRFRSDSLVTEMSEKAGEYAMPNHGFRLLGLYERLYRLTGGAVTPLIGQLMADAGYDANYSFQRKTMQKPPRWENVLSYDEKTITLNQPALLDFGAAGKGLLVDVVGEILSQASIKSFTINASGDILHRRTNGENITVGLENPFETSEIIGTMELANASLCASAGSKRKWRNFHHIIDPASLKPAENVVATWVMANDTMTADGLSTALFFVKPGKLAQDFKFEYAILASDSSLLYSAKMPINIFESQNS